MYQGLPKKQKARLGEFALKWQYTASSTCCRMAACTSLCIPDTLAALSYHDSLSICRDLLVLVILNKRDTPDSCLTNQQGNDLSFRCIVIGAQTTIV